nr:hypothetical protein [Pantoea vagans]
MFAIGLMSSGIYGPIAACMAAGMVPPLGIALATTLFRRKFTEQERETDERLDSSLILEIHSEERAFTGPEFIG